MSHAGHDGSGTGSRAAAHAGCNESHAGVGVENGFDFFNVALGKFLRFLRIIACTTAVADYHFVRHFGCSYGHFIGVADHKSHLLDTLFVHVVHSVAATATHTDHHYVVGGESVVIF